ncbi:MAG: PilZ domain-containing protein [Roseinatronobacter sp.]
MRRCRRSSLRATVKVVHDGHCERALVHNVSRGGVKFAGIRTLSAGDKAQILASDAVLYVEIVWVHDMNCGARFLPETDTRAITTLMQMVGHIDDDKPVGPDHSAMDQ